MKSARVFLAALVTTAMAGGALAGATAARAAPAGATATSQIAVSAFRATAAGPASPAEANPIAHRVAITAGLTGWDNGNSGETPAEMSCILAHGYSFDTIDVSTSGGGNHWDSEYRRAAALGLDVVLFQGYDPDAFANPATATSRGNTIGQAAKSIGYPAGATIFVDIEDNARSAAARKNNVAWVQAWADAVRSYGYTAGAYIGVPQSLTAAQLNTSLSKVSVFWRSASGSAPQTSLGYAIRQTSVDVPLCGVDADFDTAGTDNRGKVLTGAGFSPAAPTASVAGAYQPVTPVRLLDTRTSHPVPAHGTIYVPIAGRGGVPGSAAAAMVNVTVADPAWSGLLSVYPNGATRSAAAALAFPAGRIVRANVAAKLGNGGQISVYNNSNSANQVLVDVTGYFVGGTSTGGGAFEALNPQRLLDTRSTGRPIGGGQTADVRIPGSSVGAAVTHLSVPNPTTSGYLISYPAGTAIPIAANVAYTAGTRVGDLATTKVAYVGTAPGTPTISLAATSSARIDVLADLEGYWHSGTSNAAGTYRALAPSRLLDTRTGHPVGPNHAIVVQLTGRGGVPATDVSAVIVNLTALASSGAGTAYLYPSGTSLPSVSSLTFDKQAVAQQIIVPVGADGRVLLYDAGVSANYVMDVEGWIVAGR